MRSRTSLSRNGFTLIELLVVLAIIEVLLGIVAPAVQRTSRAASQLQQHRLAPLAADLRLFGDAADKIQHDLAALTAAAVQSGEQGSLPESGLRTLCGDLLDMDNTAGLLLQQIDGQLGTDGESSTDQMSRTDQDHPRDRTALRRAQAGLTESQTNVRQLEAVLSKIYSCGTAPIVSNQPAAHRDWQNASH